MTKKQHSYRLNNLKPQNKRTKNEQKEIAKKGGIKSGEVRRAKKTFRELGNQFLELNAPEKIIDKLKQIYPQLKDEKVSSRMAVILRLQHKALAGDLRAFEILRDTIGEKPVDKSEVKNINNQYANMTEEEIHAELEKLRAKTGKYRNYRSKATKSRVEVTD